MQKKSLNFDEGDQDPFSPLALLNKTKVGLYGRKLVQQQY